MDTMTIILHLLNEHKKKQSELCEYLGISQQRFTDWKSGRVKSYSKYLDRIAEFFGVSVDYLLGRSEKKETASTDSVESGHSNEEIIAMYEQLDEANKRRALAMLRLLLDSDGQEDN